MTDTVCQWVVDKLLVDISFRGLHELHGLYISPLDCRSRTAHRPPPPAHRPPLCLCHRPPAPRRPCRPSRRPSATSAPRMTLQLVSQPVSLPAGPSAHILLSAYSSGVTFEPVWSGGRLGRSVHGQPTEPLSRMPISCPRIEHCVMLS